MPRAPLSRRDILSKLSAAGLLVVAPALTEARALALWQEAESRKLKPTPPNALGPFYKGGAPHTTTLSRPDDPGLPLGVSGSVFDVRGTALPGATLEIWQADPFGQYDNTNLHYRAQLSAEEHGRYSFETSMPGHYPQRVCQHIHYKVAAPGHKTLITQLYFATDPVFEGNPDRNYRKDPLLQTPELIRPVSVFADPHSIHAAVEFEIVLESL